MRVFLSTAGDQMQPNPYEAPTSPSPDASQPSSPAMARAGSASRKVWYFVLPALLLSPTFMRAFLYEAYRMPSGSMVPTLLVGDHFFVNKLVYGIRVPLTLRKLFAQVPPRGDIIVFTRPGDEAGDDIVKRVIGLPGDHIEVRDRHVLVNGVPLKTQSPTPSPTADGTAAAELDDCDVSGNDRGARCQSGRKATFTEFLEQAGAHRYGVFEIPDRSQAGSAEGSWTVEPDHVFVLGDNRDNSLDSRFDPYDHGFGQVPVNYIKGKADIIWLSLGGAYGVRFSRLMSFIE